MNLNLAIIKDALVDFTPIQQQLNQMTPRRLNKIQFLPANGCLQENVLYFCNAEELPARPDLSSPRSLICTGFLPTAYTASPQCESLCFSTSTDEKTLFQAILDIFGKFTAWDTQLKDMLIDNRPTTDFGKMALEIFQTPAHAYGVFEKIVFMAFDENDAESQELYAAYADGYVSEDERSILYTDKEFMATFSEKGPSFSSNEIYKTQIIFNNIYSDTAYIGRFLIENTYRPFKDSDYALTEWFSEYVKRLLLRSRQFYFQTTREFEQMMQELTLSNAVYLKEYDYALKSIDWAKTDTYLCIACTVTEMPGAEKILNDAAFYLQELFDSQCQYIYLEQRFILQIINISKISIELPEILHRISIFLKNNALLAGTSSLFNDFTQTPLHFQQTRMMARFALQDRKKKLYEFDKYALPVMLHQLKNTESVEIFCNNKIHRLLSYDKENGSDLLKTLRVYMDNNQNVSRTSKALFIARTTCLYRLERIQEIAHIDFNDPKENLYVRLILQMINNSDPVTFQKPVTP